MNFDFEFSYRAQPFISVSLLSPDSHYYRTGASVDTGADITLFDLSIAQRASIELDSGSLMTILGFGGQAIRATVVMVTMRLLDEPDLEISLPVAFGDTGEGRLGNLIGLDVLEHFDFGLAHAQRLGYLGRAAT